MGNCPPQHTRHVPFCENIANDIIRDYQDASTEEEATQFTLNRACPCYDGFNEKERKQCTDPKWKCNDGPNDLILQDHPECAGWIQFQQTMWIQYHQTLKEDEKPNDMDSGPGCDNLVDNLNALFTDPDYSGSQSELSSILCPCYDGFASQAERDSCLDKETIWECHTEGPVNSDCEKWVKYAEETLLKVKDKYPATFQ